MLPNKFPIEHFAEPAVIESLHIELLMEIFSHLNPEEIVPNISLLNRTFKISIRDPNFANSFWEKKFKQHFPDYIADVKLDAAKCNEDINWFLEFKTHYELVYKYLDAHNRKLFSCAKENDMTYLTSLTYPDLLQKDKFSNSLTKYITSQTLFNYIYENIVIKWYQIKINDSVKDIDVNKTDEQNHTLLYWALECRQPITVIEALINKGAAINNDLFIIAVDNGDIDIFKTLVKKNKDPNLLEENNWWLHRAAERGHMNIVNFLLENGSNIKETYYFKNDDDSEDGDDDGYRHETVIFGAIRTNQLSIFTHLLKLGAEINVTDEKKNTPLHLAAEMGHINMVNILLKLGAKINPKNDDDESPIECATKHGHTDVVELLLKTVLQNKNHMDSIIHSVFLLAIQYGRTAIIELMLVEKLIKLENYDTLLITAASRKDTKIIRLLLNNGASIYKSLYHAVKAGVAVHVEDLIAATKSDLIATTEHNVNATYTDGTTLLSLALRNQHTHVFEILLKNGADIYTSLHTAVQQGHVDDVKNLIAAKKSDLNVTFNHGETLLSLALQHQHAHVFGVLLNNGADISLSLQTAVIGGHVDDVKNLITAKKSNLDEIFNDGTTLLSTAYRRKHTQVIKVLVNSGANIYSSLYTAAKYGHVDDVKNMTIETGFNINGVFNQGSTLLWIAVKHGQTNLVQELLTMGSNVNFYSNFISTPLHLAAKNGNLEIVELLLKHGAIINIRINPQGTPLDVALINGHTDIVQAINKYRLRYYLGHITNYKTSITMFNHASRPNTVNLDQEIAAASALKCVVFDNQNPNSLFPYVNELTRNGELSSIYRAWRGDKFL